MKQPKVEETALSKRAITVTETKELVLPEPPEVPAGKFCKRIVFKDGSFEDLIGEYMPEVMQRAKDASQERGFNFTTDILSFEQVA